MWKGLRDNVRVLGEATIKGPMKKTSTACWDVQVIFRLGPEGKSLSIVEKPTILEKCKQECKKKLSGTVSTWNFSKKY